MAKLIKIGPTITAQKIGDWGAKGDELLSIIIVPLSKTPGTVTLFDGNPLALGAVEGQDYSTYLIYAGAPSGNLSIPDLAPLQISLAGAKSEMGAWYITTTINIQVLIIGNLNLNA